MGEWFLRLQRTTSGGVQSGPATTFHVARGFRRGLCCIQPAESLHYTFVFRATVVYHYFKRFPLGFDVLRANKNMKVVTKESNSASNQGRIQEGAIVPLKLTKVTLFTIILYNSENSDIRPFCSPLLCHSSVVQYTSSLLQ